MKTKLHQQSFEPDQERKILQEIQEINKKLSVHSHPVKPPHPQSSLVKPQDDLEEKYFSQQCDDLFASDNFPQKLRVKNHVNESLFNSNSTLLLGSQFDKEVRNFPQFSTNHLSGQNQSEAYNNLKFRNSNEAKVKNQYNSRSIEKRSVQIQDNKNQKNFSSNKIVSRSSSHSSLSKNNQSVQKKGNFHQNQNCSQRSINKLIENKENIRANLNIPKNSFIKQIKNKIRFETQPDEANFQNEFLQFFEKGNSQSISKYIGSLKQKNPNNKLLLQQRTAQQCTFKPSILKKSHEIAENLQPSFERLTQDLSISKSQSKLPYKAKQQLTDKKYSASRLQLLSQPRKQKQPTERQEPNYNFRPTLSKKSLSQMANCTMDVASRNKLWLEQKQAKILRLKQQEQEKKLKKQGGSFAPKITPYKGENQVQLSRFTKQGISSYFERVSMAKQKIQINQKKKPAIAKEQAKEASHCMKKKTYDDAVKQLHKRILTMNI